MPSGQGDMGLMMFGSQFQSMAYRLAGTVETMTWSSTFCGLRPGELSYACLVEILNLV